MVASRPAQAAAIMARFETRTGLASGGPSRRYLWTDAFAVVNHLGLARVTGDARHLSRALRLIEQVHRVLGRHRDDDARRGWISGLSEEEGARHPTRGGLRIGKPLPERAPGEPFDERREWDRDGQYFHYLTRWMQALDLASRACGDARLGRRARELAVAAHRGFVRSGPGVAPRMSWKMSIDLSRPLVASMGQHDPLDGYLTCVQLAHHARSGPGAADAASATHEDPTSLDLAVRDFATMARAERLVTSDLLGLGSLLMDAWRVAQLLREQAPLPGRLLEDLLAAARAGLSRASVAASLSAPPDHRLAFRELGLAIGLACVDRMQVEARSGSASLALGVTARGQLDALHAVVPLGDAIEAFWLRPEHQRVASWTDHLDINEVMLATRLVPDGLEWAPG